MDFYDYSNIKKEKSITYLVDMAYLYSDLKSMTSSNTIKTIIYKHLGSTNGDI